MEKSDILDFIKSLKLAVVSTVDKFGEPESAVVEFGELDDFTIIIDTLKTSRKYANLKYSGAVALVIGWDNDVTVQIKARAVELSGDDLATAQQSYFAKNDRAKKWASRPDIAYFAFKPYWVRYSDVGKNPWQIVELVI